MKIKKLPALILLTLTLAHTVFSQTPIFLHPDNPHYFIYKGKPTILISSAEHYGAVLNEDIDYKKYLDILQDVDGAAEKIETVLF